jgi:hypothetical protein
MARMTTLDVEIAALRQRRAAPSLIARLRRLPPFERRAIRDPDQRDVYWTRVRDRLEQSDAATLTRYAQNERPEPPEPRSLLIG